MVAPPHHHLILAAQQVHLSRGPREHAQRPSVDVLFRSAARHHGRRVIGVVMSRTLGDGASGLQRIVECGGLAIVQDPTEAALSAMPERAIAIARPQHVAKLDQIAPLIVAAVRGRDPAVSPAQEPLLSGARSHNQDPVSPFIDRDAADIAGDDAPGRPSGYSCPDCGGVLWQRGEGDDIELVCRIGHRYNLESLVEAKRSALEGALWAGVRALEGDSSLMRRLAELHSAESGARDGFLDRATTNDQQAELLRQLINRGA